MDQLLRQLHAATPSQANLHHVLPALAAFLGNDVSAYLLPPKHRRTADSTAGTVCAICILTLLSKILKNKQGRLDKKLK
jgi:hypothetical protein